MDGILANLMSEWLRCYNQDYRDHLESEQITGWDVHHFVKPECGRRIYHYLSRPDLYRRLAVIPGSQEGLAALVRAGFEIVVVTAAPATVHQAKTDWLREHFPMISLDHLVFARAKYWVPADVFIDDARHNLASYRDHHPHSFRATLAYPYNVGAAAHRYQNWAELVSGVMQAWHRPMEWGYS